MRITKNPTMNYKLGWGELNSLMGFLVSYIGHEAHKINND